MSKITEIGLCESCHCMTKRVCGKCGSVITMDTDIDVIKNRKHQALLSYKEQLLEKIEAKRKDREDKRKNVPPEAEELEMYEGKILYDVIVVAQMNMIDNIKQIIEERK